MVDSASESKIYSNNYIYDFSKKSNNLVVDKFMRDLQSRGNLSDEEIKFLSLSKEKRSSVHLLETIISSELTMSNFEELFHLQNYIAFGGTINPEQAVRNIRYKDNHENIVATLQIDTLSKKIRLQNFGNIFPKLEYFTPYQVMMKIQNLAIFNGWKTEDGGINRFNGSQEIRYKDENGNVMAAVITKENGISETIAEYEYKSGYRSKMLLTNIYGNSIVVYDGTEQVNQIVRIDIDNDGSIAEITKVYKD